MGSDVLASRVRENTALAAQIIEGRPGGPERDREELVPVMADARVPSGPWTG